VGHLPGPLRVSEASAAGRRSLEHGAYLSAGSTYEEEAIKQEASGPDVVEEAHRTGNLSLIPQDITKKGNELLILIFFQGFSTFITQPAWSPFTCAATLPGSLCEAEPNAIKPK
jgi:hypothetical protein